MYFCQLIINDEPTWIVENINGDDAAPTCMHENVTSYNSPNGKHVAHHKPAHHHNYNNFNQNHRVTNCGDELSPPSFSSSLLLNTFCEFLDILIFFSIFSSFPSLLLEPFY